MGISLSAQTAYFLWSLVMGAALGVLYDIVRAARMAVRAGRVHIIISDVLFFAVCGVLTSLFALPFNKGDVRGFILFGEAVGFLAYRLTVGTVMGKVYAFFARIFQSFVQKIRKFLEKIFKYLLKAMGILLYNVSVIIVVQSGTRTNLNPTSRDGRGVLNGMGRRTRQRNRIVIHRYSSFPSS